ncbi:MAG: GNAT family N-acetyltransferase [Chloroflexota bacterium]
MKIRRMHSDELETVLQLWRITSAATYDFLNTSHTEEEDRGYFTTVVAAENQLWVAETEGQILGFLAINGSYVDRLYIHPEHQRKGIGATLLAHAKTLSPSGVELCTHVKNVNACVFYEKQGFVAVRYGVSPPPESEPDVEYHWRPS